MIVRARLYHGGSQFPRGYLVVLFFSLQSFFSPLLNDGLIFYAFPPVGFLSNTMRELAHPQLDNLMKPSRKLTAALGKHALTVLGCSFPRGNNGPYLEQKGCSNPFSGSWTAHRPDFLWLALDFIMVVPVLVGPRSVGERVFHRGDADLIHHVIPELVIDSNVQRRKIFVLSSPSLETTD